MTIKTNWKRLVGLLDYLLLTHEREVGREKIKSSGEKKREKEGGQQ